VSSTIERLAARFPVSQVKQRSGGGNLKLDYIDIPATIQRLREVCGMDVSWEIDKASVEPSQDGKYLGFVQGHLRVNFAGGNEPIRVSSWGGVGAMVDRDPDMAIKTAQAEAIKKAGHGFGIALYLWDEKERDAIAVGRTALASGDTTKLKTAVAAVATAGGVDSKNRQAIAEYFGVEPEELDDANTLRKLLEP
jgi:hypothetical protein